METPSNASAQTPKPEPQKDSLSTKFGVLNVLGEISQYAILGAFALYALGFLIWRAFLADYGVSSIQFLQTEYLSAAFCYLLIIALFGVPSALIWEEWFSGIRNRYTSSQGFAGNIKSPNEFTTRASAIFTVWILLLAQLTSHIFPSTSKASGSEHQFWERIEVSVLGLIAFFIILHLGKALLLRNWKNSRCESVIRRFDPNICFAVTVCFYSFWVNSNISKWLLLVTIGFYPLVSIHLWASEAKPAVRTVVVIGIITAIILHAQLFGAQQFGKIAHGWGGGKPEIAYVKFSEQGKDLPTSLGLVSVTNTPLLKGFCGPISILLKTENEIVFVNFAESEIKEMEAFELLSDGTTNFHNNTLNEINLGSIPSIFASNQINSSSELSIVGGYVKLPPNPAKLTAKQIRSDLIDVIIYAK